jgi:hypothetical protein
VDEIQKHIRRYEMKIPIRISKPLGSATIELDPSFGTIWKDGTINAVTCEICGTQHPKRHIDDDSYWLSTFLGNVVVAECCGKIFSLAYAEMGTELAYVRMAEFGNKPLADEEFFAHVSHCLSVAHFGIVTAKVTADKMLQDISIGHKI